jgi:hypothetical protein
LYNKFENILDIVKVPELLYSTEIVLYLKIEILELHIDLCTYLLSENVLFVLSIQGGVLLFVSSYFEYIRISNFLKCVVSLNPLTGVDRQHQSREARSLYPSALQPTRTLRLEFVGRAT